MKAEAISCPYPRPHSPTLQIASSRNTSLDDPELPVVDFCLVFAREEEKCFKINHSLGTVYCPSPQPSFFKKTYTSSDGGSSIENGYWNLQGACVEWYYEVIFSLLVMKGRNVWYLVVLYKSWFRMWNQLKNTCAFGKESHSDPHKWKVNTEYQRTKDQKYLIAVKENSHLL